jgi:hypothetical protein
MEHLYSFYEDVLQAEGFYKELKRQSEMSNDLRGSNENILVRTKDVRMDMPFLCGDFKADTRVLVLGLEPRHTDDLFNIFRVENRVYGTPFGVDRWYTSRNKGVYASAFKPFLSDSRLFLFSDFVKEYKVLDPSNKSVNDSYARESFQVNFEEKYRSILEKEIDLFSPDIIIALGKTDVSRKIPEAWLNNYGIRVIHHPVSGNFKRMQDGMKLILQND